MRSRRLCAEIKGFGRFARASRLNGFRFVINLTGTTSGLMRRLWTRRRRLTARSLILLPFFLQPATAERMSDAEQDHFGQDDGLDEQEGTVGAENSQRAFSLTPPIKRQSGGDDFDEPKVFVRSGREEGCVPPPSRNDNCKGAAERRALECAAAGGSPDEDQVPVHSWVNVWTRLIAGRLLVPISLASVSSGKIIKSLEDPCRV